jgi:hypothetical protein
MFLYLYFVISWSPFSNSGGGTRSKKIRDVPENESPEQKLKREAQEALKERVKDKNKELQCLKKLVDDVHAELRQVPRKVAKQHAPLGWPSRNQTPRPWRREPRMGPPGAAEGGA